MEYFGNTIEAYSEAVLWLVGLWIVFWVVQRLVLGRLRRLATKTQTDLDDTLVNIVENVRPQIYLVVAVYFAIRTLNLSELAMQLVNGALVVALVYQVVISFQILLDYVLKRQLKAAGKEEDQTLEAALRIINTLAKVILWSLGILFILSNFGVNVTSLIADLGIGGIAVALALQNILSDLFSSLAIYLDKPFGIGDTVKVGETVGKVRHIGIKTTRLQALSGEEVVFSNQELTNAQIQNFGRMEERRVVVDVGVAYETPRQQLEAIASMAQESVQQVDQARFDRAHFKAFGDSALIFEIVYYVTTRDYKTYMDVQQAVMFNLLGKLQEASVEIAYPTQTIHLRKE